MNFVLPDDERFAEFLHTALKDVHTPVPAAPREEMWASIMEQRRGGRVNASASRGAKVQMPAAIAAPATVLPHVAAASTVNAPAYGKAVLARRHAVPMRWAVPIAAAVLVLGVGAGWQFERSRTNGPDVATVDIPQIPADVPADMAAEQHMKEVNQLLVAFENVHNQSEASKANNALVEAQVAAWARDLLATTQLLMDSPLGMDPQRRKLLNDVEMVLVQISQLAPNSIPADLEITEQSIEQSQVKERLQNATPSGTPVTPQSQEKPPATPSSGTPVGI